MNVEPVSYTHLQFVVLYIQLDPDRMDVKYDKLFLVNQRGQELTARLYLTPSQTDRYILFLHGYNYPCLLYTSRCV